MDIDIINVIRNTVEPRLNYHGFKFNDEKSNILWGRLKFTRTYWGKLQYVSIGRERYDLSEVGELTSESDDIPTEICEDPGYIGQSSSDLWLSNRYISAAVGHEYGAIHVTRAGLEDYAAFRVFADVPFDESRPAFRQLWKDSIWWKFQNEADLRRVLGEMIEIIVTAGLDWLEERVAEIRRYHEKLDARRRAESERASRRQ